MSSTCRAGIMGFKRKGLHEPVGVAAEYLEDIGRYARQSGAEGGTVALEFHSAADAIRFSWTSEAGELVDGRLMPKRL